MVLPLQSQTELESESNSVKNQMSMANIAKKDLDTRTFPQICSGLSKAEWLAVRDRIMMETGKTDVCVYKWGYGQTMPMSLIERKTISAIVSRVLGIKTHHSMLFPL